MELRTVHVCFMLSVFSSTILAETGEDVKSVLTDIYTTRGYNKKIRPLADQSRVLNIAVDFYLNSVIDLNEKTESLKTSGFLALQWKDDYFTWDPSSFNDTSYVFVPQDDIWKPDVSLKNSFKSFTGLGSSYLNLEVDSNGTVIWYPYQVLESTCSVSITYFPFDVQICDLKFTAWSYTKAQVEINKGSKGIQLDEYVPNASWDLVETYANEINTDEAAVVFQIKLKRKPRFFIINIIIPIIFLSVLNVFSFFLPVTSGERASYSITVFLSLAVFLTIVSDLLPNNSENTSLLAVYLMLITSLSTAIVLLCTIQLRLHSWNDTQNPLSKFFLNFVTIQNALQCQKCRKRPVTANIEMSSNQSSKDTNKEQSRVTWLDVVNAMDFLFFIASMLYTFLCTLIIGVVAVDATHYFVSG